MTKNKKYIKNNVGKEQIIERKWYIKADVGNKVVGAKEEKGEK